MRCRPTWSIRDNLYTVDGVIMMKEHVVLPPSLRDIAMEESVTGASRIIIPTTLRSEVVRTLHSAHQGVSAMTERAKASVYWPGITTDIRQTKPDKVVTAAIETCPRKPRHHRPSHASQRLLSKRSLPIISTTWEATILYQQIGYQAG